MLRFALILILISLNFGCALPGPFNDFTTHYTQSLIPRKWSEDQKSLYLTYGTFNKEHRSNYYVLKLDIETKKYEYLYQAVGGDSLYLDVSTQDDSVFISRINQNEIHQIKEGKDTVFIGYKGLRSNLGHVVQQQFITYKTIEETGGFLNIINWMIYDIEDKSFKEIQQSPVIIPNFQDIRSSGSKAYLSSVTTNAQPSRLVENKHAYGELDLNKAKLENVRLLPEYKPENENIYLRFWDWLSEDEILFYLIDERERFLRSVSYTLSTQAYHTRLEFSKRGVLSPKKDRLAYVEGDFLIISNTDGTKPQRILNIRQDLPKGDPEFLE